jgi:carboxypeptidase family protein
MPARALSLFAAVFLALAMPVNGQVGSGQISGVIFDSSGAVIPGVTVTATNLQTAASRVVATGATGLYAMPGLAPGLYRVRAELPGFKRVERRDVRVQTGETVRIDFTLMVAASMVTIVEHALLPTLRENTASLGAMVSQEQASALPLNGRSFITLASLASGVALPPASQLPRINGGRPRTNEYLFDGISVLQPEPGQVAFFPVIDAIDEFRIETNSPPAEFGRFNGGVVNLTTKAGTNVFHGTGFEFLRHEALNARNVFAPVNTSKPEFRRSQYGGIVGGPLVRDRWFFFADYQGQRQRIGRTVISTVPTLLQRHGIFTEPIGGGVATIFDPATTTGEANGFTRGAFAGNAIPDARIDPVARALLARYPLPTSAGTSNNYRRTANEVDDQDQFDLRVDQRLDQVQVFGRVGVFRDRFTPVTPLPEGSGVVTSGPLGPQQTRAASFASAYRQVLSPFMLNELRIGDTRRAVNRSATRLGGTPEATLGLHGIPGTAQFADTLPTFQISGYQQLGSPANTASDFSTSVTEIADSFSWINRSHLIKFGMDLRWERLNVIQPPSPTGLFLFSQLGSDLPGVANTGTPLASFLLGQVQTFQIDLQQNEIRNRARVHEYFFQDEWRLGDRVTIAPGVRYTLNFPSTEEHDQAAVFNLTTRRLDFLGQNGAPRSARRLHKTNFGPRLGIVGRISDRTVVGTGYAMVWIEQAGITTPFTTPVFPFLQTVSQRTLDNIQPAFVLSQGPSVTPIPPTPLAGLGQGVFSVDADLGSGYVQQWNVSVQRELWRRTSLEVAYLGSRITRVGVPDVNINQLSVEQLALGPALLQRVPNPYFGTIPRSSSLGDPTIPRAQLLKPFPDYTTISLYRNNVGNTNYAAASVRLEQRLSRGLSYIVSYTRSKLMDDASSVFDASVLTGPVANFPVADSFNRRLERDYSTGDIPHVFVASAIWELPFGHGRDRRWQVRGLPGALVNDWSLATIVTLQSGSPVAVTQATNFNSFAGFGTQRPNLVGDPQLPARERTTAHWFNTAAFAVAPMFTLGSASRNPVRGPSYHNVDLALSRRVPLSAMTALELRAEAFNLLNTPSFGNPNAVFGAANFGTITTAGDPRVIQLALKLHF